MMKSSPQKKNAVTTACRIQMMVSQDETFVDLLGNTFLHPQKKKHYIVFLPK